MGNQNNGSLSKSKRKGKFARTAFGELILGFKKKYIKWYTQVVFYMFVFPIPWLTAITLGICDAAISSLFVPPFVYFIIVLLPLFFIALFFIILFEYIRYWKKRLVKKGIDVMEFMYGKEQSDKIKNVDVAKPYTIEGEVNNIENE